MFDNVDDYIPWDIKERDTDQQRRVKEYFVSHGSEIGINCYISPSSHIADSTLFLGDNSMIAADALIRHAVIKGGKNCSINPFAYLHGKITMGSDVRIAPHVSIIADNHNHKDVTKTIVSQGTSGVGIYIGDDVWIGSGAVILDGVKIGAHSIVAAGAIVTKEVPSYSIVAGNPARVIKNRIEECFSSELIAFCNKIRKEIPALVLSHFKNGEFDDSSINQPRCRAYCDAVELLAMFDELDVIKDFKIAEKLKAMQVDDISYEVLSISYALEVLGEKISFPYESATRMSGESLASWLEGMDWNSHVWHIGHLIDCLSTAYYENIIHFNRDEDIKTLFDYLDKSVNKETGLWGNAQLHECVNGFYRLTRGSYAQFSHDLPLPEKAIDTILEYSKDSDLFKGLSGTSCDVLDVIHPLWLCAKQSNYRRTEGKEWAVQWIRKILDNWDDGKGFSFDLLKHDNPTLMGTEMWLSILYLLCDYCGISHLLTYVPKGVHRLESEKIGK